MSPGTSERRVLNNLREQSGILPDPPAEPEVEAPAPRRFPLTPRQALMLALFLLADACVIGLLLLVVTGRIELPG